MRLVMGGGGLFCPGTDSPTRVSNVFDDMSFRGGLRVQKSARFSPRMIPVSLITCSPFSQSALYV